MEEAGHVELIIVFVNTMYIHINIFFIIYNDDKKVVGHFELGMVINNLFVEIIVTFLTTSSLPSSLSLRKTFIIVKPGRHC